MKTTISFWLDEQQIVDSIYLDHYAPKPFNEGDIIYFKVNKIIPKVLSELNEKYISKFVDAYVKHNQTMCENTDSKAFKVKKIYNEVEFTPTSNEFEWDRKITYEYYLEIVE